MVLKSQAIGVDALVMDVAFSRFHSVLADKQRSYRNLM